jgi:MFS family permease
MVILDGTIVYVALPSIDEALGFSAGGLQWVMSAYLLSFGASCCSAAGRPICLVQLGRNRRHGQAARIAWPSGGSPR